jgi:hypothetical protein
VAWGGSEGTNKVHADIEALKGFREALVRFRHVQRSVAERSGDEIEMTRTSLAAKASHWQARLEQSQAEFDACRAGPGADCSGYARAAEQAGERLEHIRRWQQRVDEAAESLLLALIADLEAARRAS